MKMKKVIGMAILIIVLAVAFSTLINENAYAANSSYVLGITNVREAQDGKLGAAYGIGGLKSDNTPTKKVWKIVSYSNTGSSAISYENAFYCIKAEHGFVTNTSSTDVSTVRKTYDTKFNMKTQSGEVITRLNAINASIGDTELSQETYNKMMWIVDNMYLPKADTAAQDKEALLQAAEIIGPNGYEDGNLLTDDDIEVVQQLALWYFTNPNNSNYHANNESGEPVLQTLLFNNWSGTDSNYKSFADLYDNPLYDTELGLTRQYQAEDLYRYFINNANNHPNYTSSTTVTSPITLNKSNFTATQEGENFIVGPLSISVDTTRDYNINELLFKDQNGNTINLTGENKLLDANKRIVNSGNILDVIGRDFYISLPITTTVTKVSFSIKGTYKITDATYYTTSQSTYVQEQPVVLVEKQTRNYNGNAEITLPAPRHLDLALRKSITKINGAAPVVSRLPQVDASKLEAGTANTATYNHPKNALTVDTSQYIEYTLTVYNEGKKDGYAAEIKDYLPAGIEFVELVSPKNKYTATVAKNTDGTSTVTITNTGKTVLNKYTSGTPKSEALTIKCKVTAVATEAPQKLVNIAEITKYFDSESNIEKSKDRDSSIANFPNDKKNNSYNGNGQIGNYIPGMEDDDDFEPVILPGKFLDLALRKSITKINGVAPVVSRLPQVDASKLEAGTANTATYNHPKNALTVDTSQYIEYTLTVYNEGEKNGYAAEIKDYLPAGIEFVELVSPKDKYTAAVAKSTDGTSTVTITNTGKTVLNKYTSGTPKSEALTIKCKVTATAIDKDQRLVNIAEITKYYDSELNKEISQDRDSSIANFPSDKKNNSYNGNGQIGNYIPGQEDDDDFEPVVLPKLRYLDLALRKSITKINGVAPVVSRLPQVDASKLEAGTANTANYNHPKNDLTVDTSEEIEYTITVYNEGEKNGYAAEIKDYLPAGIEFVELVSPKDKYTATVAKNEDGTSTVTITNTGKTVLNKYTSGTPKSEALTIKCKITKEATTQDQRLVNIAEITKYFDSELNKEISQDRDSSVENFPSDKKNNFYNGNGQIGNYVPGVEDDDDFEPVILPGKYFDLSLRKFVSAINGKAPDTSREPVVDLSKLITGESTTADYNHPKAPLSVKVGDIVTYTIRVYNEGQLDGYAEEITDHLPELLEFLPEDEQNIANGWVYDENDLRLRTIKTKHLSKEIDEENIIKAFDGKTLSYKEITVNCKVKPTATSQDKITNIADITDFVDKNGNTVPDRDSSENNVKLPTDEELPNYKDDEIANGDKYIPGQEDDDDFEKLKVQVFDLALRKFITAVDNNSVTSRIPVPTMGEDGKIKYNHTKDPVEVQNGNIVTYTLRIYNEGDISGYASEITDDLPEGLLYLPDNELNKTYYWKMIDENGNETNDVKKAVKVTTDYLSKEQEKEEGSNLIKAFNKEIGITNNNPDYKDIKIAFKVIEPSTSIRILTNIAQISDDSDENGNPIDDQDSIPGNDDMTEDDIDVEHVKLVYFDLALRKFITKVDNLDVNNRYPKLSMGEDGKIKYTHTKEPVEVENGNIVTYTIRVYNEGKMAGYAAEVTDDLPEGLVYLPENELNKTYRWKMIDKDGNETDDVAKAEKITTDYLSKEQEKEEGSNLIKAFNSALGLTDENPDYRDVKIAFKVTEPNTSDRILINTAEISKDTDKEGNPVEDIDSTPDNGKDGEDDIDIEKVKVKYFDLALKKWVTQSIVIENGKQTVTNTGHTGDENPEPVVKVDLKDKKINKVTVKFKYKIKVTNEGQIDGYVKEIKDHIPAGLKFVKEDNPDWTEVKDGVVATKKLENTLLRPGESATVDILLTWINGTNNLGLKVNIAEISKDHNDSNTPDIDSTPDNEKPGEDDIDDAPVILSVKTGEAPVYIGLTTIVLVTLAGGVYLIKKYVL